MNERRRDDLTKHFMAPYPNQEITGTPDGYVRERDGYTVRGMALMFCAIGIGYAKEMGNFAPSPAYASLSIRYRMWLSSLFPDYVEDESEMSGGYYYWGKELCWDCDAIKLFEGFVESSSVQNYVTAEGVVSNNLAYPYGVYERRKPQFKGSWQEFWRESFAAAV